VAIDAGVAVGALIDDGGAEGVADLGVDAGEGVVEADAEGYVLWDVQRLGDTGDVLSFFGWLGWRNRLLSSDASQERWKRRAVSRKNFAGTSTEIRGFFPFDKLGVRMTVLSANSPIWIFRVPSAALSQRLRRRRWWGSGCQWR
jgi:hypothetical protein